MESTVGVERYAGFETELNELVRLYRHHDGNIDARHVRRVVEEGWAAKQHLRDVLSLGPDLRVKFKAKPTVRDLQRHSFIVQVADFIWRCLSDEVRGGLQTSILEAMLTGKVTFKGREMRLGKFLAGRISDEAWAAERDQVGYQEFYAGYLLKRDADRAELSKRTFNDALSKALEIVGNLGRDTILSFNPMDILLASEQSGYRSCHRFGGEYGNGPIAYARDGFSGIVFHADLKLAPEYPYFKNGRAMVFLTAPYTAYTIGRGYGSIGDEAGVKAISEFIGGRIAASQGLAPTWVGRANHSYDGSVYNNQSPIYFDFSVSRYTYHKSLAPDERYPAPDLHLERARCLYCGDTTEEASGLACEDCGENSTACDQCGERYNEDYEGQYFNGEYYCQSCADDFLSYCEGCRETCRADGMEEVRDHRGYEVYRCADCVRSNYRECEDCNVLHHEDNVHDSNYHSRVICDDCLDEYSRCDTCDDWIESSEVVETKDGKNLGPCCIEDDHTECPGCAEWAPDDTLQSVDGREVCEDCAADATECQKCGELTTEVTEVPQPDLFGTSDTQEIALCKECA